MAGFLSPRTLAICGLLVFLMTLSSPSSTVEAGGGHHLHLGWLPGGSWCEGSTAECLMGSEEEFEMESEISRRILAQARYISYGALQRNSVPCSRRGASYYNCQRGGQANPYNRGCSAITRCRR